MRTAGLILFWLVAVATASAQTNQGWPVCRNHLRVFNSRSVDLTPLFQWWTRQPLPTNAVDYRPADITTNAVLDTDRPLAAWHRVTGTPVAATVDGNWIVDAIIYTSPTTRTNTRIILNHPPVVEEQNYYILKAQLAQAKDEIAADHRVYDANTNAEYKADERVEAYRRSSRRDATAGVYNNSREAEQKHDAAAVALTQQDKLEAARFEAEKQFKAIPSLHGTYYVDWFAVKLGYTKKGMPIYDMGLVSATLP